MNLNIWIIGFLMLIEATTLFRTFARRTTRCEMNRGSIRRILRGMRPYKIPMRKPSAFIRDSVDSFRSAAKFTLLLKKKGNVNNMMITKEMVYITHANRRIATGRRATHGENDGRLIGFALVAH